MPKRLLAPARASLASLSLVTAVIVGLFGMHVLTAHELGHSAVGHHSAAVAASPQEHDHAVVHEPETTLALFVAPGCDGATGVSCVLALVLLFFGVKQLGWRVLSKRQFPPWFPRLLLVTTATPRPPSLSVLAISRT